MAKEKEQIGKAESVRRALAKLGADATPKQISPYIKSEFGIEMTDAQISVAKSAEKRKATGGKPQTTRKRKETFPHGANATSPVALAERVKALADELGGPEELARFAAMLK
jgi:hypothetical protein